MHPYHHALSSQRRHGGQTADYLPLHNWFDFSKSALAHFTHRALHHHREGIGEAIQLFGATIHNADDAAISVEAIGMQHLAEDMSIIPAAADWLQQMECPANGTPLPALHATPSAEQLALTAPAALQPLPKPCCRSTAGFSRPPPGLTIRAISRCAITVSGFSRPSSALASSSAIRAIPTRIVAEWHVRTILGRIPAAADFLRRIKGQPWMAAAQKPRHLSAA